MVFLCYPEGRDRYLVYMLELHNVLTAENTWYWCKKLHHDEVKYVTMKTAARLIYFVRTRECTYALALHSPLSQVSGPREEETKLLR